MSGITTTLFTNYQINRAISDFVYSELKQSLNNAKEYNIYLDRHEIKISLIDTLGRILKSTNIPEFKDSGLFNIKYINEYVAPYDPFNIQLRAFELQLKNLRNRKSDLEAELGKLNQIFSNRNTSEADKNATQKQIESIKTAIEAIGVDKPSLTTQVTQKFSKNPPTDVKPTGEFEKIYDAIDNLNKTKDTTARRQKDANLQKCWNNIQTIIDGINRFNSEFPDYTIDINDVPIIVEYYYYIYMYKLVRSTENLIISNSNKVYTMTYLISTFYDVPDLTSQYINIFEAIVNARTGTPIKTKSENDTFEPLFDNNENKFKNELFCIKALLKALYKSDETFSAKIKDFDDKKIKESEKEPNPDKEAELSDSLKSFTGKTKADEIKKSIGERASATSKAISETAKATGENIKAVTSGLVGKLKSFGERFKPSSSSTNTPTNTDSADKSLAGGDYPVIGGGLAIKFDGNEKFLKQDEFYKIFNKEKLLVIVSNNRTLDLNEFVSNFGSEITDEQKNSLKNSITPLIWEAFIIYLNKFYLIKGLQITKDKVTQTPLLKINQGDAKALTSELIKIIGITDDNKKFDIKFDYLQDVEVTQNQIILAENKSVEKAKEEEEKAKAKEEEEKANKKTATTAIDPNATTATTTTTALDPNATSTTITANKNTQSGGSKDPYYEKYLKYKNKYMELKNRR